ncbi:MAG: histidine triad nucleotide-binding protein [Eubacteriales bacterium]|jgi:histidine triad (HIT) family protein
MCIFCKIIAGEIPSTKVYEDETIYAFRDINPQAPTHILIVPKRHIARAGELTEADGVLVGHIFAVAAQVAKTEGLESFRVVTNSGKDAGQTVNHLHFHLMGGRVLSNAMV